MSEPARPFTVLTGFLGSGKTTLLQALLRSPAAGNAAVLVNEVGDIALDHDFVREIREDVLVLASGCVCCALRNDLVDAISELEQGVRSGRIPPFTQVILETTGIADPTPIVGTVAELQRGTGRYFVANVLVTLDATAAAGTLAAHAEARHQLALADRVVITKPDIATAGQVREAHDLARAHAPNAAVYRATGGAVSPEQVLAPALSGTSLHDAVERWLAVQHDHDHHHGHEHHRHGHEHDHHPGVSTISVRSLEIVDYRAYAMWLSLMTQMYSDELLRTKAVLYVSDDPRPVVVQSVQHRVFPTTTLPGTPSTGRESRMVAIVRGMSAERVRSISDSLAALFGEGTEVELGGGAEEPE